MGSLLKGYIPGPRKYVNHGLSGHFERFFGHYSTQLRGPGRCPVASFSAVGCRWSLWFLLLFSRDSLCLVYTWTSKVPKVMALRLCAVG